ncbi:MAG: hypothetical protein DWQ19_09650 [Crenarchaeota archaeon]|nr:MAG: hypothetical protein DWQ19_09650 [Thermoproteota archaeon]
MNTDATTTAGPQKKSLQFDLPSEAIVAIAKGIDRGDSIAEMEALGISQRTINALEESEFCIITLEQLMSHRITELMTISNIGANALNGIITALSEYHKLDEVLEKDEW